RLGMEDFPEVVIASKSHAKSADEMRAAVESCLRALGRNTIDIFHVHLVKDSDDLRERAGALETLIRCREAGMIRSIGLSTHGPEGVLAALEYEEIEVIFPVFNRKGLGIIGGTREGMLEAVQKAHQRGIGLYAMKPLAGGHLIGDIPAAIRYVRELGVFNSIAVGLKTPEEVEIMAGVFQGDPEMIDRALVTGKERAGRKQLIVYDFCKRCGSCVEACAQGALTLGESKAQVNHEKCILCGYCAASCPNFYIRVI
ncbi:MAG: aldo/keto reductase, partial [Candidatus Latescibacterota bacterium]